MLALAVLVLPYIDLKGVRNRIASEASSRLKADVAISHAYFSLFPWPHLTLKGIKIQFPRRGELASEQIVLYPHIGPLLRKKVALKRLFLKRPVLDLTLAEGAIKRRKKVIAYLQEKGIPIIPALEIERGAVNILRPGEKEPFFKINGLEGSIIPQEDGEVALGLRFSCSGGARVQLRGKGNPTLGRGWWQLLATGIRLDTLIPFLGWEQVPVISSPMDLRLHGEAQSWDKIRLQLEGGEFQIVLADGTGREEIRGGNWEGVLEREGNLWSGKIGPLEFLSPSCTVSALAKAKSGESFSFLINGKGVKVEDIRGVALKLMGKDKTINKIFHILQGGQFSQIVCSGEGKDFRDALNVERNMRIRYTLAGGKVLVPAGPLPLEEVSGEAEISQAVLRAWDMEARLGKSVAKKGRLTVGLTAERDIFHLDAQVKADVGDIAHYLPMILREDTLKKEIKRFGNPKGWGKGRLVLGENLHDVRPWVEIDDVQVSFRHELLPWPLSLEGGKLSLREGMLTWKGAKGRLGSSTLSSGTVKASLWGKRPSLEISGLQGNMALKEMEGWLKEGLGLEGLKSIKGDLRLKTLKLKVTLNPLRVKEISFHGRPYDVAIHQSFIPFPVLLEGGDLSLQEGVLTWKGLKGKLGRSTLLHGVGRLSFLDGRPSLEVSSLRGKIRLDEIGSWIKESFGLEYLKSITGDLELKDLKLRAALNPFQVEGISFLGRPGDVAIHSSFSPVPVFLKGGEVRCTSDVILDELRDGKVKPYGKLTWGADAISWRDYSWRDAEGIVTFGRQGTELTVVRATLCDINCQGTIFQGRESTTLAFRFGTQEAEFSSAIPCLGKQAHIEGKFLLDGNITAKGKEDPIREGSQGNFLLHSHEGRIYRWTLLSRLFSLLNVIEYLKGKFPDFTQEGFRYDRFTLKGDIRNGTLHLEEAVIDGPAMKIVGEGKIDLYKGETDLIVLLAPLKTVDIVMDYIPILGKIFTGKSGTFISIPFSVKGPVDDPKITPLPPSAIGSGLWGLLKRTLQAPIEVIKPVLPKK